MKIPAGWLNASTFTTRWAYMYLAHMGLYPAKSCRENHYIYGVLYALWST